MRYICETLEEFKKMMMIKKTPNGDFIECSDELMEQFRNCKFDPKEESKNNEERLQKIERDLTFIKNTLIKSILL